MVETITLDPRELISSPFIICPQCNKKGFGICTIGGTSYTRRCKYCLHPRGGKRYRLPQLNKKIIYLDQMAISNMMKALNPKTDANKQGRVDDFYLQLFHRLDSLCKLQLIVCPDSSFHETESLASPWFADLQRLYELLSGGVTFYDAPTIRRFQIAFHATKWIKNDKSEIDLDPKRITYGTINDWQDRFIISVNNSFLEETPEQIRAYREKSHDSLGAIFERWRTENSKKFDDWFTEESMSWGPALLDANAEYVKNYARVVYGVASPDLFQFPPPFSFLTLISIYEAFKNAGLSEAEQRSKAAEYLASSALKEVPFIRISSMLYAAIARKAALGGRKKPPNQGMAQDIEMISVLLPYCDAMFIDNECRSYLNEQPLRNEIHYGTKFFSHINKDDFFKYLEDIKNQVSKEHKQALNEVYGDERLEPYLTLFQ